MSDTHPPRLWRHITQGLRLAMNRGVMALAAKNPTGGLAD
jgi:hypothetical protein